MWIIWIQSFYRTAVNGATIGKAGQGAHNVPSSLFWFSNTEALAVGGVSGRFFFCL